jgi:hypothetical protein
MVVMTLKVRSHVGRDLLQSAQLFRHEHAVIWEYVSNGLQYKDPATRPTVIVEIDPKAKKIQITDNGRGMRMQDLHRYFQMHGENLDRKQDGLVVVFSVQASQPRLGSLMSLLSQLYSDRNFVAVWLSLYILLSDMNF